MVKFIGDSSIKTGNYHIFVTGNGKANSAIYSRFLDKFTSLPFFF